MRGLILLIACLCPIGAQAGEPELTALLNRKVAALANMHQRVARNLVGFSQEHVFTEYFATPPERRAAIKARIDSASQALQARFNVEEMCVIDARGSEISRIVGGRVAPDADLSVDELRTPFVGPSFGMDTKQVYVTPPYVSPDVHKWVVAYAAPIVIDSRKPAIVHYEYSMKDYQDAVTRDLSGPDLVALAVDSQGLVLADSRQPIPVEKRGDSVLATDYFMPLPPSLGAAIRLGQEGKATASHDQGTWLVAYKPVQDWTIVILERQK